MFTDPIENIKALELTEGMVVADLGCGTGAYTIPAAKLVGTTGRVIGVDVQKDILNRVKDEANAQGLSQVEVMWGDIEVAKGSGIRSNMCDAVIISNTLFQAEDKTGLLTEAARILKPGGRLLLIDWLDSFGGIGPARESVVTQDTARRLLGTVGFEIAKEFSTGDHHYGIIGKKI